MSLRPLVRSPSSLLVGLAVAAIAFAFDQLTKAAILAAPGESFPMAIVGNFVRFVRIGNPDTAFGLSLGSRFPYSWVSLAIALYVLFLLLRETRRYHVVAYGLLIGGALGNVVDRFRFGFVVDFVEVGVNRALRWPVFNLADAAVVSGIVMVLVYVVFVERRRRPAGKPPPSAPLDEA